MVVIFFSYYFSLLTQWRALAFIPREVRVGGLGGETAYLLDEGQQAAGTFASPQEEVPVNLYIKLLFKI